MVVESVRGRRLHAQPVYELMPRDKWVVDAGICQRADDFLLDDASGSTCCPAPDYCCPNSLSDCSKPEAVLFDASRVSDASLLNGWRRHYYSRLATRGPATICNASDWNGGGAHPPCFWAMDQTSVRRVRDVWTNAPTEQKILEDDDDTHTWSGSGAPVTVKLSQKEWGKRGDAWVVKGLDRAGRDADEVLRATIGHRSGWQIVTVQLKNTRRDSSSRSPPSPSARSPVSVNPSSPDPALYSSSHPKPATLTQLKEAAAPPAPQLLSLHIHTSFRCASPPQTRASPACWAHRPAAITPLGFSSSGLPEEEAAAPDAAAAPSAGDDDASADAAAGVATAPPLVTANAASMIRSGSSSFSFSFSSLVLAIGRRRHRLLRVAVGVHPHQRVLHPGLLIGINDRLGGGGAWMQICAKLPPAPRASRPGLTASTPAWHSFANGASSDGIRSTSGRRACPPSGWR